MRHDLTRQPPSSTDTVSKKTNILCFVGLLFCFVVAYAPVLKALVHTWATSDDYSHGFFIIPISLFIVWQKKEELSRIDMRPSMWGVWVCGLSLAIYFIASLSEIRTLSAITIVPLWGGIILYLCGYQMLRAVIFPLFFLLCMIPIPTQIYSSMTIPLQLVVTKVSVMLTSDIGVPIYAEGNIISLPGRTLEVVEACSGLRSLISLFVLSLVFGYFTLRSNVLRGVLLVSTVPVAILVNIVRVSLIIVAFYYFDLDLTVGTAHTLLGLAVFLLALILIFIIKRIFTLWNRLADEK